MKRYHRIALTLALFFFAVAANAQGAREFIINHFVADNNEIESHLVITDVDGQGPTVTIKFYNAEGAMLGQGTELLPKFGKLNLNPAKYVGKKAMGTIHIASSSGNIVAEYWQFYAKASREWENTSAIGYAKPGYKKLVCPHFVADKAAVESYLVLANSNNQDVTATITFYGDDGRELGNARKLVKANGNLILAPSDVVKVQATGVAHITAEGGRLTGEYWQKESAKSYQRVVPMGGL